MDGRKFYDQPLWTLKVRHYLFLLILPFVFASCELKNEEQMEQSDCDTLNITYEKVKPIFDYNCVRCHNPTTNYFSIILNNYDDVSSAAQSGLLFKAVNHINGVTPMPFQLPQLEVCDLNKINVWIKSGTPK